MKSCQGVPTLASQLSRYPTLLQRCCCVDVYEPLPHDAYVSMARKWLRKPDKIPVPWNMDMLKPQIDQVGIYNIFPLILFSFPQASVVCGFPSISVLSYTNLFFHA